MRTARLDLAHPTEDDIEPLYRICSDPTVWTHFPSLRHDNPAITERMLLGWIDEWRRDGLGTWIARERGSSHVLGYGGCSLRSDAFWNLGYRFESSAHGRGFATEVSSAALERANLSRPDLPVVAYLVEHNIASARVAEKIGLELVGRGPDVGNPDPDVLRLVYADRALTDRQLQAVLNC